MPERCQTGECLVTIDGRKTERTCPRYSDPPGNAEDFAESLERRRQASRGLEDDLLNDVPMLYGSPGGGGLYDIPTQGDPGIVFARIHREDMLRRNGYDVCDASGPPSEVSLPYERMTAALAVLLFLIVLFAK